MSVRGSSITSVSQTIGTADEVVLPKPTDAQVGVTCIIAHADSGLTSPVLTLKDGSNIIGIFPQVAGEAMVIMQPGAPAPLDNNLTAVGNVAGITLSAWGQRI